MGFSLKILALAHLLFSVGCVSINSYKPDKSEAEELRSLIQTEYTREDIERVYESTAKANFDEPVVRKLNTHYGKHYLDIEINGEKMELLVDWGVGSGLALTPDAVLDSEATLTEHLQVGWGVSEKLETRLGIVNSARIGDAEINELAFTMLESDIIVKILGFLPVYYFKGLVGPRFFAAFGSFSMDLVNDTLYLGGWPKELNNDGQRVCFPVEYVNGSIYLSAEVDGDEMYLNVDIGGLLSTLSLTGEAAQRFIDSHDDVEASGTTTGFYSEGIKRYEGRVQSIRVRDFELKYIPVTLNPNTAKYMSQKNESSTIEERPADGQIGNAFFGKTLIGLDFNHKQLCFIPVAPHH